MVELRRVRGTILLTENAEDARKAMSEVLRKVGYGVLEAPDAVSAWEISRRYRGRIDLLITAIVMPKLNGPELAHQVKRFRPGVRTLFLSDSGRGFLREADAFVVSGLLERADGLLTKPFSYTLLLDKIADLLSGLHPNLERWLDPQKGACVLIR